MRVEVGMFGTIHILKIRFLFAFCTCFEFYKKTVFALVGRGIWTGHEFPSSEIRLLIID